MSKTTLPVAGLSALAAGLFAAAATAADKPAVSPEHAEFFEAKVRPVLVEHCQECHGRKKSMAGLRLDTAKGFAKGSDSGAVVVPGDPDKSLLIKAVRWADKDMRMPPKTKMPQPAIEVLTEWVRLGAPWPETKAPADTTAEAWKTHWAFQPVRKPAVPAIDDPRARHPVDAFVLARLRGKGLSLSPEADRRTLLRRVTLDLHGLPPTAEEIAAFEADASPDAWEKVIDRLLASPRYGERWARHWLDVSRYADTKGYVFQEERRYPFAYTYRDYVIRAFNEDLPYDRFIVEQLAADQLELGEDKRPLAAMGFLTLGRRFLNNTHDIIDDRIDTVARGLMGLTVACARCHDHKFDPIPIADYYSLYGVFAGSIEPKDLPLIGAVERTPAVIAFEKGLAEREKKAADYLEQQRAAMTAKFRGRIADALIAVAAGKEGDRSDQPTAGELPGRYVQHWREWLAACRKGHDPVWAPWHAFAAVPAEDFAAKAAELSERFSQNADPKKPIHPLVAAMLKSPPTDAADLAKRYGALFAGVEKEWAALVAKTPGAKALPDADRESLRARLHAADFPTNPAGGDVERFFNRAQRDRLTALRKDIDNYKASNPAAPPRAMVLIDAPSPTEAQVFLRGNPNNRGPRVPRRFLSVIAGADAKPFAQGSGRLELARAIADAGNPLTARVMVNRIWQHHFGAGIVRTPGDFGLRSDPPTHPELLDYLAAAFVEQGWSVKKMHRLILTSAAYRQRSDDRPDHAKADPDNTLVWKFNRRRLDFEATRDSLLAVSGALDLKMGGPSVEITTEPFSARRSVYAFIERQNLPGLFRTFDFAGPDTATPQRHVTTVPQQALFLMNSPFVRQQARRLLARPEVAGAGAASDRIPALYRLVYGRAPTAEEAELGRAFVEPGPGGAAVEPSPWSYGWGAYDADAKRLKGFAALPHFSGKAWQGGPKLPDPKTGWAMLTAGGGHPGDPGHSVVRRWTAPADGTVAVSGALRHPDKQGDGVRGRLVHSRLGELGSWIAENGTADTAVAGIEVKKGDTLDFVVDCRRDESFDSFQWAPEVRASGGATWRASADFRGPAPNPADVWELYAHALLMANEFAFVD
jgi:cytochrome c553